MIGAALQQPERARVRIEQLEYLAAVTQHGSLRRAADHLHLSQPALSEALTKLERELRVPLLDRRRSGARISREGRELLPAMAEVLASVDRLRAAAGGQRTGGRTIRLGTVHAATSTLLVPAVRDFQERHPACPVEVVTLQPTEIDAALTEGTLDLGLVNVFDGDDCPPELHAVDLVEGAPVVVLPAGHRLASRTHVTVAELREERFVMMRAGHLMHRYVHRLFAPEAPIVAHSTDGAELGKALVADGVGITVLPDYSVADDPLVRAGLLTSRPIADDHTPVRLVLRHRRSGQQPLAVAALAAALRDRADSYRTARAS